MLTAADMIRRTMCLCRLHVTDIGLLRLSVGL